jgi:hypothetical protein
MANAMSAGGANYYQVQPAVNWNPDATHGVSGTPTDYFYRRQWTESKPPLFGWLIEYGPPRSRNELNPEFPAMSVIMNQVNGAIIQLSLDSLFPLDLVTSVRSQAAWWLDLVRHRL